MNRTPLFAAHQKLGGKLIEFGGWEMPVQYTSIMDEHLAVRKAAGIFDISHMGEVIVSGPAAETFLNATLTNEARNAGQANLKNASDDYGAVAVQGPRVAEFIDAAFPGGVCGGAEVRKISD